MTSERELESTKAGVTRGFLFADLRGYTSFLETNGASAATELLTRYRALVREVVARFGGAEIRTEGDGFYVVFNSVSSAVRAGLDILDGARDASASTPLAPIRTAIGVHAGETVDSDEGYVGAAVNIAARLCAQAEAGQLLVTDTVRTLTASVLPVHFVAAGKRRLKGVPDPVVTYRVEPGRQSAPAAKASPDRRTLLVGGSLAVIVVLVLAAVALPGLFRARNAQPAESPTATPSPGAVISTSSPAPATADQAAQPLPAGPLPPGTYVTQRFKPTTILTVGEGWSVKPESPDYLAFSRTAQPDDQLTFHVVLRASSDGCYVLSQPITGPLGLYDWLDSRPELDVGTIVHGSAATVDGTSPLASSDTAPTWRVDLSVTSGASCEAGVDHLYFFPLSDAEPAALEESDRWLSLRAGDRSRIEVASLESSDVTMVLRTLTAGDFGPFASEVEKLLAGTRFVVDP